MSERRERRLAPRPAVPHPVRQAPTGPSGLLSQLQRQAGNAAVASLFVQRAPVDERDVGGVVDGLRTVVRRDPFKRRIEVDVEKAAGLLAGLTHEQGQQIKEQWLEKDGRPLPDLLLGQDDLFPSTSLRPDQFKQLMNLLGGTRAANASELNDAQERGVVVEAAKLHDGLRQGASGKEAAFAALGALHLGSPERKALLERVYAKHFSTVAILDLNTYLAGRDLQRALALFTGDTTGAEAFAIEQQVEVKRGLEHPTNIEDVVNRQDRQHKADAAIEEHLSKLRAGGPVESALRQSGHGAVLGELDTVSQGDAAAVQHALIENDQSRLVAARLAGLLHEGKLTAKEIEHELTGLRAVIAHGVHDEKVLTTRLRKAFLELEVMFIAQTQQSLRYVISITGSKGPRVVGFGDAKLALEPDAEQERNAELLRGFGEIVDDNRFQMFGPTTHVSGAVLKLELAVRERDASRMREALEGKTRKQVEELASEYQAYTHRELKTDVLGSAEMQKAVRTMPGLFDNEKLLEKAEILEGDTFESTDPWLDKDSVRYHREEAVWIYQRIGSLYERVVDNRGLFAEARDWVGNIEKTVVDDARKAADAAYWALLADVRQANVEKQLSILHKCQARLEHNVETYKEATKEAFDAFVEAAVFAVTTALTLGEGGAVVMAWRSILGTVGTKFVLKGEDYSLNEASNDILEGVAGAAGSAAAKEALDKVLPVIGKYAEDELLKAKVKIPAWAKTAAEEGGGRGIHFVGEQGGSIVATGAVTGKEPKFGEFAQEGLKELLKIAAKSARAGAGSKEAAPTKAGAEEGAAEHAQGGELPGKTHPAAAAPEGTAEGFDVEKHLVGDNVLQGDGRYVESKIKRMAIESWEKGGDHRLVKVVSAERGASQEVGGFVTEIRNIRNQSPAQMEQILGLPKGALAKGAVVHTIDAIPNAGQFKLKGLTQLPDGKTYRPGDPYPKGSGVPQWKLTTNMPVAEITTVAPNQRYQPGVPSPRKNR
ncbi:MAG: hypothetical protein QOH92_2013 [Chloroflexota bacterium]|nr:hypothetical protein [Chloroflexota bacterium]